MSCKQISLVFILVLSVAASQAADWPHWRGPERNGISRETGWQTTWPESGPKILWKASTGTGFSSFTVADGRVFTMGNQGDQDRVVCLDAVSGKVVWAHTYPEPLAPQLYEGGPNSTPTVDGDRVYTMSRSGKVFCLEASSGRVVWSSDLVTDHGIEVPEKGHWGLSGSPFIEGDLVIVNAGRAGMALNKATGELAWLTGKEPAGYATPVPFVRDGQRSLLIFTGKSLAAIDPANGKQRWDFPWKTSYDVNAADPVVNGTRIFISSGYNVGGAVLELASGEPVEVWRNRNMRNQMNSSVLWKGHLYGVDENQLRCLDFGTGEVKWTERAVGKGSLMLADSRLIVLSDKGELLVAPASPEAFTPSARAQILGGRCWTAPVLAHGRIYARNAAGDVVCVDLSGS